MGAEIPPPRRRPFPKQNPKPLPHIQNPRQAHQMPRGGVKQSPNPLTPRAPLPRRHAWLAGPPANTCPRNRPQNKQQQRPPPPHKTNAKPLVPSSPESPSDTGATSKEKNNILEFSAWLTVLEQRAIRNLPRQRAPTPLFPERRPREALPISGCHDNQPPLPQQPPKQTQRRRQIAVASRQRSRNAGGMRRLAAEIPDIFIPLSRNDVRNDDDIFDSDVFPAGDSFTGSPAPPRQRKASEHAPRRTPRPTSARWKQSHPGRLRRDARHHPVVALLKRAKCPV